MTRDTVFVFVGGIMIGAAGTAALMRKLGYIRPTPEQQEALYAMEEEFEGENADSDISSLRDNPSFTLPEEINTVKVRYDAREEAKPSLDEMVSRYETEAVDEDDEADEAEDYPQPIDPPDVDEYGHVILQLPARRKDDLIYLVPQEHAGEIYVLDELVYYEGDDVLADMTDAPVDDPLTVIGDSLGYFGQYGADADKLFVRNCRIGIEYEVTRIAGRYADHLYGLDVEEDAPTKTPIRKSHKEEK